MTHDSELSAPAGLLLRVKARAGGGLRFKLDGRAVTAHVGDTLLTAILLNGTRLRQFEFGDGDRAGFCLMGACQDCWIRFEDGRRVRACSTLVEDGMAVTTGDGQHG